MQDNRSIIGGCNVTQPTRISKGMMGLGVVDSLIFGYLLTTSQSVICVRFESRFKSRPFLEIWTTAYSSRPVFAVDNPKSPLTPEEQASRKVTIHDLDDLVSVHLESIGHADISLMQLTASFRKGKTLTVSFYTPEEGRAVCKPLAARLRK